MPVVNRHVSSLTRAVTREIARLEIAVAAHPDNADARARLGALLFAYKRAELSAIIEVLNQTLGRDAAHVDALYWLANVRYRQQDYAAAHTLIERAIALRSGCANFWLLLISTHKSLGTPEPSITPIAEHAVQLAPAWPNARLVYANSLFKTGRLRAAEQQVLAALAHANSVALPTDPLEAFVELTETGRLATDTAQLTRILARVRRQLREERESSIH